MWRPDGKETHVEFYQGLDDYDGGGMPLFSCRTLKLADAWLKGYSAGRDVVG
jgi:hypothetical protein